MTNDDLKRFYPVNENSEKSNGFARYDEDGNLPGGTGCGVGVESVESINLVVGEPEVIYDTEDGITINSQGTITAGGLPYNIDIEQNIPIVAQEGIIIDASEDGKSITIKKENKYMHYIRLEKTSGFNAVLNLMIITSDSNPYTTLDALSTALVNEEYLNKTIQATGFQNESLNNWSLLGNVYQAKFLGTDNVTGFTFETHYIYVDTADGTSGEEPVNTSYDTISDLVKPL
jgi:hypothetical protein